MVEFHFEQVAVACGAEQHRLALEGHVRLAPPEYLGAHVLRLGLQLIDRDRTRPRALTAHGQEVLAVLARRFGHDRVRHIQHRLRRAVILGECYDFGCRLEALGEAEDVLNRRRTEGVDRLRVIAHHHQP